MNETRQNAPQKNTFLTKLRRKGLKVLAYCERARVSFSRHPVYVISVEDHISILAQLNSRIICFFCHQSKCDKSKNRLSAVIAMNNDLICLCFEGSTVQQ